MRSLQQASLVVAGLGIAACHTYIPTPAGTTAAPVSVAQYEYPADATHANGWHLPEDSTARRNAVATNYSDALIAFKRLTSGQKPLRVAVYYNSKLTPEVAAVRRPAGNVVELDYEEHGPKGTSTGRQTLRFAADGSQSAVSSGAQNVDALMAQQLEAAIVGHLLEANARVVDKGLLFRKSAAAKPGSGAADAELRALSNDVDLVMEVTFVPNAAAHDGFELGLRAIRTKDATVLAQISSAESTRRSGGGNEYVAQQGGYVQASAKAVSLRDLCNVIMAQAMSQVAARY